MDGIAEAPVLVDEIIQVSKVANFTGSPALLKDINQECSVVGVTQTPGLLEETNQDMTSTPKRKPSPEEDIQGSKARRMSLECQASPTLRPSRVNYNTITPVRSRTGSLTLNQINNGPRIHQRARRRINSLGSSPKISQNQQLITDMFKKNLRNNDLA